MARLSLTFFAAAVLAVPLAPPVLAHHGWNWAEEAQSELTGTVDSIDMDGAHPNLTLTTDDGVWTVDLGNPRQTAGAGFTGDSVSVGDAVTALGDRDAGGEKRFKAVRLTAGEDVFTFYPERIRD